MQETWVWSLGWEDPLETGMATTPVFLPGESHGQRSLEGYSPPGCEELDTTYSYHFHFHLVRVVSGDLSSSEGIRQWFFPHGWAWNSHSKWKTNWQPPCLFTHSLLTSPLSDPPLASLGWINAFSVLCDVLHEEVVDKTQQGAHGKVPAGMGFGWVGICLLGVRGEEVEIISGLKTQFLGFPLPQGWGGVGVWVWVWSLWSLAGELRSSLLHEQRRKETKKTLSSTRPVVNRSALQGPTRRVSLSLWAQRFHFRVSSLSDPLILSLSFLLFCWFIHCYRRFEGCLKTSKYPTLPCPL